MELTGEQLIPADRQAVWDALNDPEALKACIPGCQELVATGDNGFEATVQAKVGPVKAKFKGAVTLSNIDAPNGYTISGEGKGGAAGFAKGGADVHLEEAEGGTLLKYEVNAKVGGKLAQIGSRLIDSTAKKMAADFFEKFSAYVAPDGAAEPAEDAEADAAAPAEENTAAPAAAPSPAPAPAEEEPAPAESAAPAGGASPTTWIIGLVAAVAVLVLIYMS